MKKYVFGVIGALMLISIMIMTQIPAGQVEAQEESEFVITNGTLVSYNGVGTQVSIPGNVTAIGPEAFEGKKLTSVTIPSTVKNIERAAFRNCKSLTRVTFEEGVRSIGVSAFSSCDKLNSVVIPASVTKIGAGAFSDCDSLRSISLVAGNNSFFCNDGVLYNQDSTELIQYLAGRKSTAYTMPFTVEKIDAYAFWGADLLTQVEVSNNVSKIDSYTFSNCTGLSQVFLPESVSRLEAYAFSDCKNLIHVGMENSAVNIDENAFYRCTDALDAEQGVTQKFIGGGTGDTNDTDEEDNTQAENEGSGRVDIQLQSPVSTIQNRGSVDMTSPKGLLGASRIVGGSALIILDDQEAKSDTTRTEVSQNRAVSENTSVSK